MQIDTRILPVRGHDTVEILLNDHEVIKSLLARLTGATEMKERKELLEQLKGALTIHNATEENIVYPALNKIAGKKAESEHLYHETAEADVLLFELDSTLKEGDDATFSKRAEKFQSEILHHMENEETSALPHLQEKADPKHAKMLTETVREFRKSVHVEIGTA
jgi:hemerythrin superfamily protein